MVTLPLDTNVLNNWVWAKNRSTDFRYSNDPAKWNKLVQLLEQLIKNSEMKVNVTWYNKFNIH